MAVKRLFGVGCMARFLVLILVSLLVACNSTSEPAAAPTEVAAPVTEPSAPTDSLIRPAQTTTPLGTIDGVIANGNVGRMARLLGRAPCSRCNSLLVSPADVVAAAQANPNTGRPNQASAANDDQTVAPPLVEPLVVPVNADGSYSVTLPAGTDYSLSFISEDASTGL